MKTQVDKMGKRPQGKCALCIKEYELTFEHIPPRTAFNSTPVKPVTGNKIMNICLGILLDCVIQINNKEWRNIVFVVNAIIIRVHGTEMIIV
ncbi:MAG: hypothetical protein J6K48_13600 [Lachnospiraceae bacterium]|nr:hypothetical protein [Lachnospiraceae bacterium]